MNSVPDSSTLPFNWKSLPSLTQAAGVVLGLYFVVLIWDQLGWWMQEEEYHFGFLIPFFVWFVWTERWPLIRSILDNGGDGVAVVDEVRETQVSSSLDRYPWLSKVVTVLILIMTLGAMLLFLFGGIVRLAEGGRSVVSTVLFAASFAGILLGIPYLFTDKDLSGRKMLLSQRLTLLKLLVFPAIVWLIASPLPGFVKQEIQLFLLDKVVNVVYFSFELFGYPLLKEGNSFVLPEGRVGVADACSGIRSLTGCVVTGSFLAAVSFRKWYPKVFLMLMAVLLAVFSNFGRSLFLTVYAYNNGGDSISGFVHDATGYAILVLTAIGLLLIVWVMTLGNRDWNGLFQDSGDGKESELKKE